MLILIELNGAPKLILQKCPNGCRHLTQFSSLPALKSGSFSSSLTVNSTTSKAVAEVKSFFHYWDIEFRMSQFHRSSRKLQRSVPER